MLKDLKPIELNAYHLKMIALVTMLLDHIPRILYPDLFLFKVVGRVAFVLYSFMLVEGFIHSRDSKKYFLRLLLFALISEMPYDLAFGNQWYDPYRQNIFFTLCAGLCALFISNSKKISSDVKVLLIVVLCTLSTLFHFDYLYLGVLQVLCFYVYRNATLKKFLTVGLLNVFFMFRISTQAAAILGFIPIYLYNGKQGNKTGLLYYTYYPVHLFLYWLIRKYFLG